MNEIQMDIFPIVGVASLTKMFEQIENPETCCFQGKCHFCGRLVNIEISKTSGGYGLLGGVLYEPDRENFIALCGDCYGKNKEPRP